MDAWPIGYKPAKPLTSPESERAKKIKLDKDYNPGKRIRTIQAAWLVVRKCSGRDGSMFCKICCTNVHQHAEPGRFTVGTSSFQITSVKSHEQTMSHEQECLAIEAALKPVIDSEDGKILVTVTLNRALTEKLRIKFRSVHALAKHDRPFTDYVWQCELDELKGVNVGQYYRSDKAAADFAHHIAEVSDCEIYQYDEVSQHGLP